MRAICISTSSLSKFNAEFFDECAQRRCFLQRQFFSCQPVYYSNYTFHAVFLALNLSDERLFNLSRLHLIGRMVDIVVMPQTPNMKCCTASDKRIVQATLATESAIEEGTFAATKASVVAANGTSNGNAHKPRQHVRPILLKHRVSSGLGLSLRQRHLRILWC